MLRSKGLLFFVVSLGVVSCRAAFCGLDIFGICGAANRVAESIDKLPDRVREAADDVLDHFFENDFGPAVDKLTAAAKALADHALQDYKEAVNATSRALERLARKVVVLAEELARDVSKDVEGIVAAVERDCVHGVEQIVTSIGDDVMHLLDRLEMDGKELICAAQGYTSMLQEEFSSYFQKQDCECVQEMLAKDVGLQQDCPCTSCVHLGGFYPKCQCRPWGLNFSPGWFNRGKYDFLKCHLLKPVDWEHWTTDQIVAQLAIVQEAALSFRCLEDLMPGSTLNRDYFSAEYLNVTHTILVLSSATRKDSVASAVVGLAGCEGKTLSECVTYALEQLSAAEQQLDSAKVDFARATADLAANYSRKADVAAQIKKVNDRADEAMAAVPVGTIMSLSSVPERVLPKNFLLCDGTAVSRIEFPELFSAVGETWGVGDRINTFNVPDLRGRTIVGQGVSKGLTARKVSELGGAEVHQLIADELPAHSHSYSAAANEVDVSQYAAVVNGNVEAVGGVATMRTNSTGGNRTHNNMQPFAVVAFYIKASTSSSTPSVPMHQDRLVI